MMKTRASPASGMATSPTRIAAHYMYAKAGSLRMRCTRPASPARGAPDHRDNPESLGPDHDPRPDRCGSVDVGDELDVDAYPAHRHVACDAFVGHSSGGE